ncbi:MAG: tetratricopeptide repeat protein [Bacteroidota bacterium]
MIKPLYKSFIPYLVLLMLILVVVFIFDRHAERISMEPDFIVLGEESAYADNLSSWFPDNEMKLQTASSIRDDTLYQDAMHLFRQQKYRQADEKAALLLSKGLHSGDVLNLRGLIAVRLFEHQKAEAYFLSALESDPGLNGARINLASLYMNIHRYKEAESLYEQAREYDPYNPGIYYNMGLLFTETGQTTASMEAFLQAAELSSGKHKSKALCQLGMVRLEQKDSTHARTDLNEAILLNPRNELARLYLALTFDTKAEREEELIKIYKLNPTSFQANYYLGKLYNETGLHSRAEYHYKKALARSPNDKHVMKELGDLLISQQRMEEAELVLSGFNVGDTLPQAYFFQAKIAAREGNTEDAIQLYSLAAEKSYNNYPEAYLNLAVLYKEQQEKEKAIENYRNAIKARPHYSLAHYNLALLYTEMDSTRRAIDCYKESIRFDPDAVKSWYNLGRIYDKQEDSYKAIDAYRNALSIQPDYTRAMLTLANAYLKIENYQTATDQYLRLLAIYPNYSKAWFNLGLACTRQNMPGKAIEAYEKLIEVDPGHVRARINLAILYSRNKDVELAVSVLEDAMDIEMDNPGIRFNLALQLKKLERYEQAVHQLNQVILLDKGHRSAYQQLLMIYNELGDDVNYELIFFKRQMQFDSDANLYETGKRLVELGEPALALEAFDRELKAGNKRTWLLYWTGKAHLDLKQLDEAIQWFHLALEQDPDHKFSLYRLGQAHEMQGEPARAENYYASLLERDQEFKIVHKSPIQ